MFGLAQAAMFVTGASLWRSRLLRSRRLSDESARSAGIYLWVPDESRAREAGGVDGYVRLDVRQHHL